MVTLPQLQSAHCEDILVQRLIHLAVLFPGLLVTKSRNEQHMLRVLLA